MDRRKHLEDTPELLAMYDTLKAMSEKLGKAFIGELNRMVAWGDLVNDRWEKARMLGFGEGSNIYDDSLVIGDVAVGSKCWVGPGTILDGSGGLKIGDNCTVSAGVQIYTHDNVMQTLTGGAMPIERAPVTIGNNVYIAPNAVITKGVTIGNHVVIGAYSLVNKDIPDNTIVFGQPARQAGNIVFDEDNKPRFVYKK